MGILNKAWQKDYTCIAQNQMQELLKQMDDK